MTFRRSFAGLCLALCLPLSPLVVHAFQPPVSVRRAPGKSRQAGNPRQTCLAFVATNLAKGNGNWFEYCRFSDRRLKLQPGDALVYSVFLDVKNPVAKGGLDVEFEDGSVLRDEGLVDQNGVRAHGDGLLSQALGRWYTRRISVDKLAGRTASSWDVDFEGDIDGLYAQFISDVQIEHADGSRTVIYAGGPPQAKAIVNRAGYSEQPVLIAVDKAGITDNSDVSPVVQKVVETGEKLRVLDEVRQDIDLARKFVAQNHDPSLEGHINEATTMLNAVEQKDPSPEEVQAVLHAAQHALSHTHPVMEQYTGHLVGHAHIDLQWLWEWQEGMVFARDTFNQAANFMDEFPGFTFSQSSSCLYQMTEEHYPELFKRIKSKVKSGQWEIVGGRVCEGDTNMISPESHARHFLYGQRYFRERFGKTAVVGWEPDTFGHTAQMPQILKLGGCSYYYFCRGGKQKPLFWWVAPDGSRVLAFDEPANGSWYNSDLSYAQFEQMLNFNKNVGSKDMLWVYGVGNHGGGPTREYIQTALSWMKDPTKPKVKFSTASQFFKKLETYDLTKIPKVRDELNPVFDGCYTSHSEIKQANRNAEAETTSAEALATVASLGYGFAYPKETFRKNWEDICFNHHHDTLPGSGIHAPYERTKTVLSRVISEDKDIETRALETMTLRITPKSGGMSLMVFNPTGWTRSGWVETWLVQSAWDGGDRTDPNNAVAEAPNGSVSPVVLEDAPSRHVRFWAKDLPPYGYTVYRLRNRDNGAKATVEPAQGSVQATRGVQLDAGGLTAVNSGSSWISRGLEVHFDTARGLIDSLVTRNRSGGRTGENLAGKFGLGGLRVDYENPQGMSAWVLGEVGRRESLVPVAKRFHHGPDWAEASFDYVIPAHNSVSKESRITQTFRLTGASDQINVRVDCDWNAIGTPQQPNPLLRAVFNSTVPRPTATYDVPFAAISRPVNGQEWPALEWADLGDAEHGISVLNDSKQGYSADGETLTLSLIRSNFEPDPVPNPGHHSWNYAIYPRSGGADWANVTKKAAEFNQPLLMASVPYDAKGSAPLEFSPVQLSNDRLVATALKRGEDDGDLILRFFEDTGQPAVGSIHSNVPASGASWVNFVEDYMAPATLVAGNVPVRSRGFEIKTVKLKLQGSRR